MAMPEKNNNELVTQERQPAVVLPLDRNVKSLVPQTMAEAIRLSEILAVSQFVPKDFRGKPGDVLAAMLFGAEIGLKPLQALQNVSCINGKPAVWGDAALAVCQAHPDYIDIVETLDEQTMTAQCIAKRRGRSDKIGTFSKQDAIGAYLWNKNKTPWVTYPKVMLKQRARGFALRAQFPDALKGLITAEEAGDYNALPEPAQQQETTETRQDAPDTGQVAENAIDVEHTTVTDGPPSVGDICRQINNTKSAADLSDVIDLNMSIWNDFFKPETDERKKIETALSYKTRFHAKAR